MASTLVSPPTSLPARSARQIEDPLLNYVFNEGDDRDAFDVQPKEKQTKGPAPLAEDKEGKGPSVLSGYKPKKTSGALDREYKFTEETPVIGRTYHDADLVDILRNDALLEDLAITIAERGVVFFRNQERLTIKQQKELVDKLGLAGGKPKTSGLHIHPTALSGGLLDGDKIDPEISLISSKLNERLYHIRDSNDKQKQAESPYRPRPVRIGRDTLRTGWHSDITFEPVPADFSLLRIVETPSAAATEEELAQPGGGSVGGSGGDTLWASGYALAERLSPEFLSFLETLKGDYNQPVFAQSTASYGVPNYTAPRGAPENVGELLGAIHPVVRTNPITGWKSVFAIGEHFDKFVGLSPSESELIRSYLIRVLVSTPEIQVRFKWNKGDIAIWDNRSTYHSAIPDLVGTPGYIRTGVRTVGIGERPFFDPKSKLRYAALEAEKADSQKSK